MANFELKSPNKWQTFVKLYLLLSVLPLSTAFLDQYGQLFPNGMGQQMTDFVDNLYNSVDSWAEHIVNHAKDEECLFICPNGKIIVANESYVHEPNGCGSFGLKIKEADLPVKEMRFCCDEHQMCYHKCGVDKNQCDEQFNRCLVKKCKESQKDPTLLKGCKTATKLLMMSFLTFGCKTFKDSQRRACICSGAQEL